MYELREDRVIVYAVAHPKLEPGFGRSVEHAPQGAPFESRDSKAIWVDAGLNQRHAAYVAAVMRENGASTKDAASPAKLPAPV